MDAPDFLIIGAGVVGLSLGRALAKKGQRVLLVEQNDFGTAASGTNLGQISVGDRNRLLELDLVRETQGLYELYNQRYGLEYAVTGGLCTVSAEEDLETAQRKVEEKNRAGYDLHFLRGPAIQEVEPHLERLSGAVYSAEEGKINPLKVNHWLFDQYMESGGSYLPGARVTGFEYGPDNLESVGIETNAAGGPRKVKAGTVILAAGAWSTALLKTIGLELPMDYIRGTAMVTEPYVPTIQGIIEDGAFFLEKPPGGDTIYLGGVQEENGTILIAQANKPGRHYDRGIDPADLCKMAALFLRHFPSLNKIQIVRAWSGITPLSLDDKGFWGFTKKFRNLFLATGFKGAFSTAPAIGLKTADWLCDGVWDAAYNLWNPARVGL